MKYAAIALILVLVSGVSSVTGANYMYEKPSITGVFSINETINGTPTYVTCPSGCTCMGEKNAANQGRVPCGAVNGSCGVNELGLNMYCYSDIVSTTTIPTTLRTPTATSTTNIPTVTVTAATESTQPSGGGAVVLSGCGPDCRCMLPDAASSLGLPLCGGTPVLCSYDAVGKGMYCYALTQQPVSPASSTQPRSGSVPALTSCPSDCTCLDPATATQIGLSLCGDTPVLCNYDAAGKPLYCYNRGTAATPGQAGQTPSATGIPLGPFIVMCAVGTTMILCVLHSRKKI